MSEGIAKLRSRSLYVLAIPKKICKLVSPEAHDEESAGLRSRSFPMHVTTRCGNFRLPLSRMAEAMTKDAGFIADPFSEKARSIIPLSDRPYREHVLPLPRSYGTAHAVNISIKYTLTEGGNRKMKKVLVFVFAVVIAVAFAATGFAQAPAAAPAEKAPVAAPEKTEKPAKVKKAKKKAPKKEEKKEEAPAPAAPAK